MGRLRGNGEIEDRIAETVVRALGASRADRRDRGGGEQIRDFDIVFDDGHTEPLEITLDADKAVVQTWDRLDRANELPADLECLWMTSPSIYDRDGNASVVDVRSLREVLIPFLQGLERDGIHEFTTVGLWGHETHGPTARKLSSWGIHHAVSTEVPPEHADTPRLHLASSHGGWVDSGLITHAVEREAEKEDNRAKLAACPNAPRRHLYVGLTSAGRAEGMAWWALLVVLEREGELPPIPKLPEEITTVWAGTGSGAIYVTAPDPWVLFRNPDVTE